MEPDSHRTLIWKLAGVGVLLVGFPAVIFGWMRWEARQVSTSAIQGLARLSIDRPEAVIQDVLHHDVLVRVSETQAAIESQVRGQDVAQFANWPAWLEQYALQADTQPHVLLILESDSMLERQTELSGRLEYQLKKAGARRVRILQRSTLNAIQQLMRSRDRF